MVNRLASLPRDARPSRDASHGVAGASAPAATLAVTRLSLSAFRCYEQLRLDVEPRNVVLTGPNGAGKTNLLEALSFLAPGRGLRRAQLGEPDRHDAEGRITGAWAVAAVLATPAGPIGIGTGRDATRDSEGGPERRIVRIDGMAQSAQKHLAEQANVVWLTPEMDRLFADGPAARRRFLDRMVYGFDPEHTSRILAYDHRLRERARLLAEGAADAAWLDALEDGMAAHGVAIAAARAHVAARLDRAGANGVGSFPYARLAMTGEIDRWLAEGPALAAEDRMRERLAASRPRDAEDGGAAAGPHRSDLQVRYGEPNQPAAACSTGEQKALLLSILLSLGRELAAERGRPPLLLLDEVVAHLDGQRRAALYDELAALGAQAWLTGTDDELFAGLRSSAQFFRVTNGMVAPR